jgi:hypothetical protein
MGRVAVHGGMWRFVAGRHAGHAEHTRQSSRRSASPRPPPNCGLDLIPQEDPAPPELAARQQPAARVFKDRREREVEQLSDATSVEDVIVG